MKPILITGCPRSGTSLVAAIIAKHGVFAGDTNFGKTKYNPIGMYENIHIRNKVAKKYLISIGADDKGQDPLPDRTNPLPIPEDFRENVLDHFRIQGWDEECQWFLKEAKMALMWEVWHSAFPDAQWVLVRRNEEDIIKSCQHTPFMSNRDKVKDWKQWVNYHKDRFKEMKEVLDIREVWPDKLRRCEYTEINNALEWLEIRRHNSTSIVDGVFNAGYWHNTVK